MKKYTSEVIAQESTEAAQNCLRYYTGINLTAAAFEQIKTIILAQNPAQSNLHRKYEKEYAKYVKAQK